MRIKSAAGVALVPRMVAPVVIVDTYNVLHAAAGPGAVMDVAALAGAVRRGRYARQQVVLVCDGTGGGAPAESPPREERERGGVRVVYAGPGRDADTAIERLLDEQERRGRGRGTLVVSSDRRLRTAATGVRAASLGSDEFVRHLLADAANRRARTKADTGDRPEFAARTPLGAEATAWWLREFGFETDGGPEGGAAGVVRDAGRVPAPPGVSLKGGRGEEAGEKPRTRRAAGEPGVSTPTPLPPPSGRGSDDALLRAALEEWAGRLSLDDLDMRKWVKGVEKAEGRDAGSSDS